MQNSSFRFSKFNVGVITLFLFGVYYFFPTTPSIRTINFQREDEKLTNKGVSSSDLSATFDTIKRLKRPPIVETPPEANKMEYRTLFDVVNTWNPDIPDPPADFKETLQHFDYGNPVERELAIRYRNAEIPFKIYNISEVNSVSTLWSDEYLLDNLARLRGKTHVEKSKDNHFMFWSYRGNRPIANFVPPTEMVTDITFAKWLQMAKEADLNKMKNNSVHYYFMASADAHENGRTFVSRDLNFLSTERPNFFITNVKANKGIQCRFGMRGIIAESHYDSGKNMITLLRGRKRYIINPPKACKRLAIISDKKHPSFRHSVIDWSDIDQARSHEFDKVDAIDTIVSAGEVLYIPSFWFHYVISLDYSIQCNSRSGFPESMYGKSDIDACYRGSTKR